MDGVGEHVEMAVGQNGRGHRHVEAVDYGEHGHAVAHIAQRQQRGVDGQRSGGGSVGRGGRSVGAVEQQEHVGSVELGAADGDMSVAQVVARGEQAETVYDGL